jgi:hypothetical protein
MIHRALASLSSVLCDRIAVNPRSSILAEGGFERTGRWPSNTDESRAQIAGVLRERIADGARAYLPGRFEFETMPTSSAHAEKRRSRLLDAGDEQRVVPG